MSINITDEEVDNKLNENSVTVIDFWAPWCGPCKMYGPIIEDFAKDNTDVGVFKINVDEYSDTATKHGVRSIPTTILFKNGRVVSKIPGVIQKKKLQEFIDNLK